MTATLLKHVAVKTICILHTARLWQFWVQMRKHAKVVFKMYKNSSWMRRARNESWRTWQKRDVTVDVFFGSNDAHDWSDPVPVARRRSYLQMFTNLNSQDDIFTTQTTNNMHDRLLQRVSKSTQNCFCHHFVKFPPTLIIFGTKMATTINSCEVTEVRSFSTLTNSHQSTISLSC